MEALTRISEPIAFSVMHLQFSLSWIITHARTTNLNMANAVSLRDMTIEKSYGNKVVHHTRTYNVMLYINYLCYNVNLDCIVLPTNHSITRLNIEKGPLKIPFLLFVCPSYQAHTPHEQQ